MTIYPHTTENGTCSRCSEVVSATGHICIDAIPLYGTDQYDQLDSRTLAEFDLLNFRPLKDCQAWRWGDPDHHTCGDAIVQLWFAVVRVGDKVETFSDEKICFNLVQKLAGIDHLIFMHPIF